MRHILVVIALIILTSCLKIEATDSVKYQRTLLTASRHIYVISAVTGKVLIHGTVYGKVRKRGSYWSWCDTAGDHHEHSVSENQIIHITDNPMVFNELKRMSE